MAETNGTGRLDRIEAILDEVAKRNRELAIIQEQDHEEFARSYKQLMTWQVLMQDKMDKEHEASAREHEASAKERQRLDELWANTDKRIADLVIAIGQMIKR